MTGRAFVFGDDIDTDLLAPGAYMKGSIETIAAHCLEAVDPDFAKSARPGDVVVAGRNFGIGSSREQAAQALTHLGISAVAAVSFGGIFFRNALNLGLPALVCPRTDRIRPGDLVKADARGGFLINETTGERLEAEPLPGFLADMLESGGLIPYLERRLKTK